MNALAHADVFVLPSRNEAFSIALLEAGALGKPVVATSVCGVPELIQDGFTGVRVPPEDVDALANGILRVLHDRETAARYGRRLRDLVQQRFTLDASCARYLCLAGYPPP
jgi:glycosyltransferase involved in cell wall biosynthesis